MMFNDVLITLFIDAEEIDGVIPEFETILSIAGRLKDTRKRILKLQLSARMN